MRSAGELICRARFCVWRVGRLAVRGGIAVDRPKRISERCCAVTSQKSGTNVSERAVTTHSAATPEVSACKCGRARPAECSARRMASTCAVADVFECGDGQQRALRTRLARIAPQDFLCSPKRASLAVWLAACTRSTATRNMASWHVQKGTKNFFCIVSGGYVLVGSMKDKTAPPEQV